MTTRTHPEVSNTTQELIDLLVARDQAGRAKYGTTLDRDDLAFNDWLQHMAEELLDGAGYALAAKRTSAPAAPSIDRSALTDIIDWWYAYAGPVDEALGEVIRRIRALIDAAPGATND